MRSRSVPSPLTTPPPTTVHLTDLCGPFNGLQGSNSSWYAFVRRIDDSKCILAVDCGRKWTLPCGHMVAPC
jgi:hypothetical protein